MMEAGQPAAASRVHHGDKASPRWPISRLLFAAAGWIVLAIVMQLGVTVVLAFVVGVQDAVFTRSAQARPWAVPDWFLVLAATATFQLSLLFIACRRGKVVGGGDARQGLGIRPLRRRRLLAGLSMAIVPAVYYWAAIMLRLSVPATSGLAPVLAATREQAVLPEILLLLVAGTVAPIAEELFFRGWLWTGLRRHLDPFEVMLITSALWLSLHMLDGAFRPLYLFPSAAFLSVARHYCDSVRASVILHLTNNVAFLGIGYLSLRHLL